LLKVYSWKSFLIWIGRNPAWLMKDCVFDRIE